MILFIFVKTRSVVTMKTRLLIRTAIIVSVVLLCTGFGMYSLFKLSAKDYNREVNLYKLVPHDAIAVLETDRMDKLIDGVSKLQSSKDNHFLYVSDIFVFLKRNLHTLLDATPHGLSRQMNKMLLSFHEPDNPSNQVLYCSLGDGDEAMVEAFIKKYCSAVFPLKIFDYKGEEIKIYTMADGRFLAIYMTSDFLVASLQKHLIEEVIDAHRSKISLADSPSFSRIHFKQSSNVEARVYVRMKAVEMGKQSPDILHRARLGSWGEFDLKFNDNAIYCSGVTRDSDSTETFVGVLAKQQAVEGFGGEQLPTSTVFFDCWSASNMKALLGYTSKQVRTQYGASGIMVCNSGMMDFLKTHTGDRISSLLFYSKDTLDRSLCSITNIPLKCEVQARKDFQSLIDTLPVQKVLQSESDIPVRKFRYTASGYPCYILPCTSLLADLGGFAQTKAYVYLSFYKGHLLLAPDEKSLLSYIDALEHGENLKTFSDVYNEVIGSLSSEYNFVMMGDMETLLVQPDVYASLIPNFFFRQYDFFRHFIFAVQFVYADGVVYPNIVLRYKNKA